jgi:glycosyltransferase involved in cell wall biosynthesis
MLSASDRSPVAVIVLTWNEEANIEACLASVHEWCGELFVVDSGSTDRTVEIARRFGATVVEHAFTTHTAQWTWALDSLGVRSPWVLALDADQRVSPQLRDSLRRAAAEAGAPVAGYHVNRRQIFRGRWIRHGGYYPKYLLKFFRRGAASLDPQDLVDHHFRVQGHVGTLAGDLIEDNANEQRIGDWVAKHNRYARLQAEEELARLGAGAPAGRALGSRDERRRWRKRLWQRSPLYLRSFAYFGYRYIVRLGFLDGREGLVFHFMQALWYRLLVDINREELTRSQVR